MAAAEVTWRLEGGSSVAGATSASTVLQQGRQLAERFTILGFIAAGGMGEVYDAFDAVVGTRLALKVVRRGIVDRPLALERLRTEVQLARRVSHPSVARVFDLFACPDLDGTPLHFLTMERLDGTTLEAHVRGRGRIQIDAAWPILRQVGAAIDAAHAEGVVHCDLKASNVMLVRRDADAPRAVLTDFGIARSTTPAGETAMAPGSWATPACMAPEQRDGAEVGPPADIYAFGRLIASVVDLPRTGPAARRWRDALASCLEPLPHRRPGSTAVVLARLAPRGRRARPTTEGAAPCPIS